MSPYGNMCVCVPVQQLLALTHTDKTHTRGMTGTKRLHSHSSQNVAHYFSLVLFISNYTSTCHVPSAGHTGEVLSSWQTTANNSGLCSQFRRVLARFDCACVVPQRYDALMKQPPSIGLGVNKETRFRAATSLPNSSSCCVLSSCVCEVVRRTDRQQRKLASDDKQMAFLKIRAAGVKCGGASQTPNVIRQRKASLSTFNSISLLWK